MRDLTRRTATGADAGEMEYPLCDVDRDEFRVERYTDPRNPELIAFRVVDCTGKVRGFVAFELDAMEMDLPKRMLERIRRTALPRPDLRLVG